MRDVRRALIPLAAVVLVAACGGEDRLSRDEYVKQADAICADYEEKLEEQERALQEAESPDELASVIDRAIPTIREGTDRLDALEPPEDLESQVNQWNRLNDENIKKLEQIRDAAKAGDTGKIGSLGEEISANEEDADKLARDIGLRDCAADD